MRPCTVVNDTMTSSSVCELRGVRVWKKCVRNHVRNGFSFLGDGTITFIDFVNTMAEKMKETDSAQLIKDSLRGAYVRRVS